MPNMLTFNVDDTLGKIKNPARWWPSLLKDNQTPTGHNGHLRITRGVFINKQDYMKKNMETPISQLIKFSVEREGLIYKRDKFSFVESWGI